jgi:hypothetical protein
VTGKIKDDCCKFGFIFVTWFTKHELYKACTFERGSENSFERMWCIPNGFCINNRRSFSGTSWNIGDVWWRWPWLRLRRGAELKISITFTDLHVGLNRTPMYHQFCHYNHRVLQSLILVSSSLPFIYGEVRVARFGLLVPWYIFSMMRTRIGKIEWSGWLKCW